METLLAISVLGLRLFILQALLHVVDGTLYRLLDKKGTYAQGRQFCQDQCLDLAKVTSKQDLEEMTSYFNKTKGRLAFLGAHHNGTSFNWADGEPMLINNWAPDYPKMIKTRQCVAISKRNLAWYTWDCEKSGYLLCGKTDLKCKVAIYSMTTWTVGRKVSASPMHSIGQISRSECGAQCLERKTCTHFLMHGTWCKLYNDKSTNRTTNTLNMEVWKMN